MSEERFDDYGAVLLGLLLDHLGGSVTIPHETVQAHCKRGAVHTVKKINDDQSLTLTLEECQDGDACELRRAA